MIFHSASLVSYLRPKFKLAKVKLTISNSKDVDKSFINLGTILEAIAPVGIMSLNSTGPSPLVKTPRPALVPSPTTLTALVHSLLICFQSLGSASTI